MDSLKDMGQKRATINPPTQTTARNASSATGSNKLMWLGAVIVTALMVFNLALSFRLLSMSKMHAIEIATANSKIVSLSELLTDSAKQMSILSSDLKAARLLAEALQTKAQEAETRFSELDNATSRQKKAIEEILKAKDKVFDTLALLEAEITALKGVSTK